MTIRYIRKTVITAKLETTSGTDAVPTGAANALKVFDMSISPVEMTPIQLNYISAYFGSAMTLPGSVVSKCSFSVSLSGAGDAATAPAWGALLLGCANSETTGLSVPPRVEYLPATDLLKNLTIYYYDDGLLHPMLGCFGNVKLSAKAGEAPKLVFDFIGVAVTPTAVGNATPVLTAWKPPVAITMANVTDITLGCTYAVGALTGGTPYNSTGLTLDWGNKTTFTPMLSVEKVALSDRKIVGALSLELTAAQEASMIATVKAGTTQGLGFVIGKTSGNQVMLHAPAMRLKTHKKEELNGMRLVGFDFELDPVSGNDELRVVLL
ncbi:MAG: hypothetical protein Q8R67_12125 [Rhodoferax sp.]|nr:hypothetical protein [Rhodoferax sp.]MDP3652419.1 hypothetical protein [Rhodoferax sp.]